MLPYLMPYRVRWIAMIITALASLGATVSIPLMTKAVIDGPVRHQNQQGLWVVGAAAMAVCGERLLEKDADECSPRGTHSPRGSLEGGDPETGAEDVEVLEDNARLGRGGHF